MDKEFRWRSYHAHFATIAFFLILNPIGIFLFEFEYWGYYIFVPSVWVTLCYLDRGNANALKVHSLAFVAYTLFATAYIQAIENSVNATSLVFILQLFVLLSISTLYAINHDSLLLKRLVFASWVLFITLSYFLFLILIINGPLIEESVFAILQTHSAEAGDFFVEYVLTEFTIIPLTLLAVMFAFVIKWMMQNAESDKTTKAYLPIIVLSFGVYIFQPYKIAYSGIYEIEENIQTYFREIERLKEVVAMRNQDTRNSKTEEKSSKGEIHVLVMGESLSSAHMSAYGYVQDTTPWLNKTADVIFNNARSNHTHTMPTLSKALTESNQYNGRDYYDSESIISVAKKAGFETAWISNQVSLGAWDNLVSVVAQESDYYRFINKQIGKTTKTQVLDEQLVPALQQYLDNRDPFKNHFIVLHMMGSHWSYCDRTKGLKLTLPPLPDYIYLNKQNECYDLSVMYTDLVLEKIHRTLAESGGLATMLFTADHADDVFGKKKHNAAFFNEHMTDIPLVLWVGEKFDLQQLPVIEANKNRYFTNDLLFDSLIGLMGITSEAYSKQYDIASEGYKDLLFTGTTLHGQAKLSKLPTIASRINLEGRHKAMAHRVNTVGAMNDAKNQGFNAIEFDVVYDEETQTIVMGHGIKALTGQTFRDFLRYERAQFDRLWIDFKNLTEQNLTNVANELEALDAEFDLKARALLESGITSEAFAKLSDSGWKTSYYLPTKKILDLIKADSDLASSEYAKQLINQVADQKVRSLSFDSKLYGFVLSHLADSVDKDVRFNTWTSISSAVPAFAERYDTLRIVNDARVDSVIVRFPTRFKM